MAQRAIAHVIGVLVAIVAIVVHVHDAARATPSRLNAPWPQVLVAGSTSRRRRPAHRCPSPGESRRIHQASSGSGVDGIRPSASGMGADGVMEEIDVRQVDDAVDVLGCAGVPNGVTINDRVTMSSTMGFTQHANDDALRVLLSSIHTTPGPTPSAASCVGTTPFTNKAASG